MLKIYEKNILSATAPNPCKDTLNLTLTWLHQNRLSLFQMATWQIHMDATVRQNCNKLHKNNISNIVRFSQDRQISKWKYRKKDGLIKQALFYLHEVNLLQRKICGCIGGQRGWEGNLRCGGCFWDLTKKKRSLFFPFYFSVSDSCSILSSSSSSCFLILSSSSWAWAESSMARRRSESRLGAGREAGRGTSSYSTSTPSGMLLEGRLQDDELWGF